MFRTQFDNFELGKDCEVFPIKTRTGSKDKILYEGYYDEVGKLELREKGVEDLYGYIQSFKDSVNIHTILKKFKKGDVSVLQRVQGSYGDFTNIPDNIAVVLNQVNKVRTEFDALPVEIKSKFNNNYLEYVNEIGSESYFEKLGFKRDQVLKAVDKDGESNESK